MTKNYETENKNMNSNTDKALINGHLPLHRIREKISSKTLPETALKTKLQTLTTENRTITLTDTKEKNQQKTNVSPFLQNYRMQSGCRIRPVLSSDLFLRPLFCI